MAEAMHPASATFSSSSQYRHGRMFRLLTRWRVTLAVQVMDIAIILGTALILFPLTGGTLSHVAPSYVLVSLTIAFACHMAFMRGGLYGIDNLLNDTNAVKSIIVHWLIIFLSLAAAAYLTHQPDRFSRAWFIGLFVLGAAGLSVSRIMVAMLIRRAIRRGYVTKSIVLVGHNKLAEGLIARLKNNRSGIRVVGIFDDRAALRDGHVQGVPLLGGIGDLLAFSKLHMTDLVILTLPLAAPERLNDVIAMLRHQPLNIRILQNVVTLDRVFPARSHGADLPGIALLEVAQRPVSELALIVKCMIDYLLAALGLLILSPLLICLCCGIALSDPGPVLFRQTRVGYRGCAFQIYKFRTMYNNRTPPQTPTKRGDSRIFPFGDFLRKFSLDELPQLMNVLAGDMSLVGPRPHMVGQQVDGKSFFEAVNEYAARHRVKPGITGWAQVNGWRGPTDTVQQVQNRVEHDIYYIENWSLLMDFMILVKTIFVGFFGKNAF